MGGSQSTIPDNLQAILDECEVTKKDLQSLRKVFRKWDTNKDGKLDNDEVLKGLNEKTSSSITRSLFSLMDLDSAGYVSYNGFLWGLFTFGLFGEEQLLKFAFMAYDKNSRGAVKLEDANELLTVAAKELPGVNPWDAGAKLDLNGDGKLDYYEFVQMSTQLPTTMHQTIRLQEKMRINTLGVLWFNRRKAMDARRHLPRQEIVQFLDGARAVEKERKKLLKQKGGWFCKPTSSKGKRVLCQIVDADTHGALRQLCKAGIGESVFRTSLKIPSHGVRGVFEAWQGSSQADHQEVGSEEGEEQEQVVEVRQAQRSANVHHRSDRATRLRRAERRKAHKVAVFEKCLERKDGLDHKQNGVGDDFNIEESSFAA